MNKRLYTPLDESGESHGGGRSTKDHHVVKEAVWSKVKANFISSALPFWS
jgi:hypothetical protein